MLLCLSCYKLAYHCFSYICGVATISLLTLAVPLLRRWRILWGRLLLGVRAPGHLPVVWSFIPLCRPVDLVIRFALILVVINTSYTVIHYLSLLCVKLILAHIKVCIQFCFWKLGVTQPYLGFLTNQPNLTKRCRGELTKDLGWVFSLVEPVASKWGRGSFYTSPSKTSRWKLASRNQNIRF
jgi:hypothetical protein